MITTWVVEGKRDRTKKTWKKVVEQGTRTSFGNQQVELDELVQYVELWV